MRRNKSVLTGFVLIVLVGLLVVSYRSITRAKPVMADLTPLPTIVIDPGHGGVINTII